MFQKKIFYLTVQAQATVKNNKSKYNITDKLFVYFLFEGFFICVKFLGVR
jgi:hypothetical protein